MRRPAEQHKGRCRKARAPYACTPLLEVLQPLKGDGELSPSSNHRGRDSGHPQLLATSGAAPARRTTHGPRTGVLRLWRPLRRSCQRGRWLLRVIHAIRGAHGGVSDYPTRRRERGLSSSLIHACPAPFTPHSHESCSTGQDTSGQRCTSIRTVGKRVGGNHSRVRISYPPPSLSPGNTSKAPAACCGGLRRWWSHADGRSEQAQTQDHAAGERRACHEGITPPASHL